VVLERRITMTSALCAHAAQSEVAVRPPSTVHMPDQMGHLDDPLLLCDGSMVQVRPIQPDDGERLVAFHARLSPETIEYRYFGPVPVLAPALVEHLTHVDYAQRMALVAITGREDSGQIIAVVRYEGIAPETAEVAFVVEDRWQGHGIATQLLYRLALYARRLGFTSFVAEIMSSNRRMREVIAHAGFPFTATYEGGCVEMRMDITAAPTAPFAPSVGP
jgi:RimJ/RimL family protein N-acetyltransferase